MPAVKVSHPARPVPQPFAQKGSRGTLDIIDIRGEIVDLNLKDEVSTLINPSDGGPRRLPTLLLYDEKGLQLFEEITYLDEYYLTNSEIELLEASAADMARDIPAGAMVIELGSGNLRKVCLLLQAFEDQGKAIDYYALDLSQTELERTLSHVPSFKHVSCHGLLGTYDDGCEWLKHPAVVGTPKCILHLGSSIGNFHRHEAAAFLQGYADILTPADSIIMGIDSCSDPDKIYHAYNDKEGVTHRFILNGLSHANDIFEEEIFHIDDWKVIGEYVFDDEGGRHQAFLSPIEETNVLGTTIKPHERIQIEQSLKYSPKGLEKLWGQSGLNAVKTWTKDEQYGLHKIQKTKLPFSKVPSLYATSPLPTMDNWESIWEAWEIVTERMLPEQELHEKPIKLRNACIFYLGHIPTFLDIQLTKRTNEPPTDPAGYHTIFERGIDPDVDNPEKCHDHSVIPDEWPPAEEIALYRDRVRARLRKIYENGQENISRRVGRAIWLAFEHELMHVETLLYMMLQSDRTLPPPHTGLPDFERLARNAREKRVDNLWFDVPEQEVRIGLEDAEDGPDANRHFGWDNEKPARNETVHAFQAKGRPITNEEYAQYLHQSKTEALPASWSEENNTSSASSASPAKNGTSHSNGAAAFTNLPEEFLNGKGVRTVYGIIPLKHALDWPVFASYDEIAGCAKWMGGRIPTFEEAKSIYAYAEAQKEMKMRSNLERKVPAVNGHLVNDGVEETPPTLAEAPAEDSTQQLFLDLSTANVGFRNWHPVSVTARGGELAGQAGMGGVWEWTSSPLRPHAGFEPMPMYPGYTADFFDEKHNIVLGGSWATHPRIAGRKTFVNWYQRNYPYAWVGARLVRDVQNTDSAPL